MEEKKTLPIFITRDVIIFPKQRVQLEVGRAVSIAAINASILNHKGKILVTLQKDPDQKLTKTNFYNYGILAEIESFERKGDDELGIMVLSLKSSSRVAIKNVSFKNEVFFGEYSIKRETKVNDNNNLELLEQLNQLIQEDEIIRINDSDRENLNITLESGSLPQYIDFLVSIIPIEFNVKLELLKENNIQKRLQILVDILKVKQQKMENTINTNSGEKTQNEINEKVRSKLSKQQREFYLREQLKIIKEELDEISGEENEFDSMKRRITDNPYPEHIKAKLLSELNRLQGMPAANAESNVIRNYIEWLLDLPYWQKDEEIIDINEAKKVLDSQHFGLEKPKKRIIEFLAQKQKNPEAKPTIICFIGPPGTGKTTLSKSIASALKRKFAKISLGGVKDESEIRGHRRTYIASNPGKIIQAMKKTGVINPVILLDEIDKMASDYKGDPAAAMLEVLDYEQNNQFQDHFIEEDYDLSNVMFIATANSYEDIPSALFDRLEIIELNSYTELEKLNIAKKHLIPKILDETKLAKKYFKFTDKLLLFLIRHYTIEAGVRQLNRVLLNIARKIIVKELNNDLKDFKLDQKEIIDLLGKERFEYTEKNKKPQVGVVTGLAWTSYGGDILPIEVTLFEGKGDLILTGQQRDVMKESANIALGFIRSNYNKFGIDKTVQVNGKEKDLFKDFDIHVHVPDGATPKDGPSAGITFTTALVSALSKKPVSQYVGMTGEITLHGKVFPIGGLKEKSISAYRSKLKKILIPKKNLKDLEEIPQEVKDNLQIIPVEEYEDVYKEIFGK